MKFLAGFITSLILCMLLFIGAWLYFDLPIDTNDNTQTTNEMSQDTSYSPTDETSDNNNDETTNDPYNKTTKQKHNGYETPTNEVERLPNLSDKEKALSLMKSERASLSDEDKQIFDGVIETAKTNINNGVGTAEDYSYLNHYKKLEMSE